MSRSAQSLAPSETGSSGMNGGSARFVVWSPKPITPGYGYGLQIGSGFTGPGWVGHDGGFPGIEAFVSYHPFGLPWMA